MAKEIAVPMWQSNNGKMFENRAAAEFEDLRAPLVKELEESELYFSSDSSDADDIAVWFLTHYTLTPKGGV